MNTARRSLTPDAAELRRLSRRALEETRRVAGQDPEQTGQDMPAMTIEEAGRLAREVETKRRANGA